MAYMLRFAPLFIQNQMGQVCKMNEMNEMNGVDIGGFGLSLLRIDLWKFCNKQ